MISAPYKWVFPTMMILCCTSSYGQYEEKSNLMLVIRKTDDKKINLTCLAKKNIKFNGLSLTGPNEDQNFEKQLEKAGDESFQIPLTETAKHLDLPPVLDEQWEDFPIHGPEVRITLHANEYVWISVRYKEDLLIRLEETDQKMKLQCEERRQRWLQLQLCTNSSHLSIKSDNCTIQNTLLLSGVTETNLAVNTYYKIHEYNAITITENSNLTNDETHNLVRINFVFDIMYDFIHLSYCLTCSSCNATIRFEDSDGEKIVVKFFKNMENLVWKTLEIKINDTTEMLQLEKKRTSVVLTLSYERNDYNSSQMLVIKNMINRQKRLDHSISKIIEQTDVSNYICESMVVKLSAIPGSVMFNATKVDLHFPESKLCFSSGNCYCSSGSWGDLCENPCNDGFWSNCLQLCDCCNKENMCNKISGTCESHSNCDSRTIKGITLNSSSTYVIAEVTVDKNTLQKGINSIKIEYKTNSQDAWTAHKYEENLENPYINISDLKPNTYYSVKASFCAAERCFSEYEILSNVSTICELPKSSDLQFNIEQHEVSLKYSLYESIKGSCPNLLSISKENKIGKNTILQGLTAYTNYNIQLWFNNTLLEDRQIITKKSQSSPVISLQFNTTNNIISWKEPENPNGNLGPYIGNITHLGSILCNKKVPGIQQIKTTESQIILAPMTHYSKYEVMVQPSNEEGLGHAETYKFQTLPKSEIEANEKPKTFYIDETQFEMEIVGCDEVSGPWIIYETVFTCLDPTCKDEQTVSTVNVSYNQQSKYVRPLNTALNPFSNYSLRTSVYRTKSSSFLINTTNLKTLPSCPPPVRNLDIYSFSNSSISVRWKVPDPPNGILEKIIFKLKSNDVTLMVENMAKCTLWTFPDYFCMTLENINNKSFPIHVIAQNIDTNNCKEKFSIREPQLQETGSEAPIDLKFDWIGDMEELLLSWNHPNKTNRQLKAFKIILKSTTNGSNDIEEVFNISNEMISYNYSIKTFTESSKYKLEVLPVNSFLCSPAKLEYEIITPPPYPVIGSDTRYTFEDDNLVVNISSIVNVTKNSLINVTMSKQDCNFINDKDKIIWTKANSKEDVSNDTIRINLKNDFNITKRTLFGEYSIAINVVNKFDNITRKRSLCLTEMKINAASASSIIYPWIIAIIAIILLLAILAFIIYKYRFFTCFNIKSKISMNTMNTNRSSFGENEQIELQICPQSEKVAYENQPLIPRTNVIERYKFAKYLKLVVKYGDQCQLYTEFDSVPMKISDFSEISKKNKIKNRYLNMLPYETNQVLLKNEKYINASFVHGYKRKNAYIATQGPTMQTVDDFWEMVFEHEVKLIAMLCPLKERGKTKCDQYWPDFKNKKLNSRHVEIEFDVEKNCGVYIERHFTIKCNKVQSKVIQLQFTEWQDHHVPSNSQLLLEFLERFHELHNHASPAVVHCSAGAGRTGTLILCDHLINMEKETGTLDFYLVLFNLRKQRTLMVQTKQQYHFAHVVIYEYLFVGKSRLNCDDSFERNMLKIIDSKETIQKQLQILDNLYTIDVSTFDQDVILMEPGDESKNKNRDILPTNSGVIYLETSKLAPSTYINAINVDGYNKSEKFIVTQQPLITSKGSTLSDFWRLIIQTKPAVIISLQSPIVNFYPTQDNLCIDKYIKLNCIKQSQNLLSTTFTIKVEINNKNYTTKIFQSNVKLEPTKASVNNFVNFYSEYRNNYSRKESPVLVTCLNGCELSGLFVALDYTTEKMLQQEICDVFLAVRTIRRTRKIFITSEEQFRFLYRCALEIRRTMCTIYSNIS